MGTVIIKDKYQCCISDSKFDEQDETEENIVEEGIEPLKPVKNILHNVESFQTLPVLN